VNPDSEIKDTAGGNEHGRIPLPETILLVEDDHAHAQLITRALKSLSINVLHKDNASDAIECIPQAGVDIVITDLNLVTESGFDLISDVTAKYPELPIIVLTSSSNLDDAVRAMKEGAWDYLSKHFSSSFSMHLEMVIRKTWERAIEKQNEIEAQAERNAFWMAATIADDGLAILDSDGGILYHNPVFERFLDILSSASRKKGSNIISMISPVDFRLSQNLFTQIHLANDSIWKSELKIPDSESNKASYYDMRLSTVISEHNESAVQDITYHILWVRDVTREKNSKDFERNLLSSTTHDLKGPLAAILTSTEMLLEESTEKTIEKSMLRIASCARTSLGLIDQLLSLKRIQDGFMQIHPKWISLTDLAEEIYEEYSAVAKSRNIRFVQLASDELLSVFADKIAIKRICGNLLGNAFKFTPAGGEVGLEIDSFGSDTIIKISDTGSGIPNEYQGMLFEMYERLTEHSSIEGSGLGLYITKQLVDMHHGVLELKSTPGIGTSFTILFKNDLLEKEYSM
jgi:signal transduction histidine kinase